MRLTRVYIDVESLDTGQRLTIEGSAGNHITRVLRLRVGDEITVFNGRAGEYSARIEEIRRDTVDVSIGAFRRVNRASDFQVTLVQGISRGERMDWVVQKATELGVRRIEPVFTERSVVHLDEKQAARKVQHWQAIAQAACEQCGMNWVPYIAPPRGLYDHFENSINIGKTLVLSARASLRIADITETHGGATVLIGPEGGLSEVEHDAALKAGYTAVRMGPRVLRTETAAVCAVALLQQTFGDL